MSESADSPRGAPLSTRHPRICDALSARAATPRTRQRVTDTASTRPAGRAHSVPAATRRDAQLLRTSRMNPRPINGTLRRRLRQAHAAESRLCEVLQCVEGGGHTLAVRETDPPCRQGDALLGALNVASQPARCSIGETVSPRALV